MAVSSARVEHRPDQAPRRVTILGSTGSVGCNTIDLIDVGGQARTPRLIEKRRPLRRAVASGSRCRAR